MNPHTKTKLRSRRLMFTTCSGLAALSMSSSVASAAPFLSVDLGNSQSVVQAGFQSFNQHDAAGRTYATPEGDIFVNVAGEQPAGEDGYYDRGPIPDNPPFTYGYIGDAGQMPVDTVFGPAYRFAAGTFHFVPATILRFLSLTDTEVTLGWDGGGVLQESTTLSGWADIPGITSGDAFPRAGPLRFYRVRP